MTGHDPWFVKERAVAFASLVLTRHEDVSVRPHTNADTGVDLLVELLRGGKSTLRFFGVHLVGYVDLPADLSGEEPAFSRLGGGAREAMLPICVFAVGVRKPEGAYRWAVAPAVEDGRALLRRDGETRWEALDEAGVARLVGQVN